ncbi:MAG TPA: thiamine diphosphokinase [Lactobacillaceae bacterium]|jgi:thiamine pyrophosphokinase
MIINILAGGPTDLWPDNLFEQPGDWLGADRGAWHLLQHGIKPLAALGDFDSLTSAEQAYLHAQLAEQQITHVKAEKDETDTELALLHAAKLAPTQINVFGVTGGRLDHLLSNLWVLTQPEFAGIRERVTLWDATNAVIIRGAGAHTISKLADMMYLGFMPMESVVDFKILDAKYPLVWTSETPKMWSSNEFVGEEVHIEIGQGLVMIVQARD